MKDKKNSAEMIFMIGKLKLTEPMRWEKGKDDDPTQLGTPRSKSHPIPGARWRRGPYGSGYPPSPNPDVFSPCLGST
jgi:hypothetical protein